MNGRTQVFSQLQSQMCLSSMSNLRLQWLLVRSRHINLLQSLLVLNLPPQRRHITLGLCAGLSRPHGMNLFELTSRHSRFIHPLSAIIRSHVLAPRPLPRLRPLRVLLQHNLLLKVVVILLPKDGAVKKSPRIPRLRCCRWSRTT